MILGFGHACAIDLAAPYSCLPHGPCVQRLVITPPGAEVIRNKLIFIQLAPWHIGTKTHKALLGIPVAG